MKVCFENATKTVILCRKYRTTSCVGYFFTRSHFYFLPKIRAIFANYTTILLYINYKWLLSCKQNQKLCKFGQFLLKNRKISSKLLCKKPFCIHLKKKYWNLLFVRKCRALDKMRQNSTNNWLFLNGYNENFSIHFRKHLQNVKK